MLNQQSKLAIRTRVLALCSLAVLACAIAACSSGDDPPSATDAPTATATGSEGSPSASRTSVPSDVAIDLTLADELYHEGSYEEALVIYAAAAERGTDEEQQAGLFAMAKIQSQRGENGDAERNIEALRESDLPADVDRAALLLQGKAEFAQGDFEEAREAFEEYIGLNGPAGPYAQLYLAQIERQKSNYPAAIDYINAALLEGLPAGQRYEALIALAEVQTAAGDKASAVQSYREAVDVAPNSSDASEAWWLVATEADAAGDAATADAAFRTLITEYPAGARALEALDHPRIAATGLITNREHAYVLYRNFLNGAAETAYQAMVDAGDPASAEAQYRLGIISERYELWDSAIAHYDAAIALLPPGANDSLKAQATWDKATVLERLTRTDEAIVHYAGVADIMPAHDEATEGLFRAGLLSYQLGRPENSTTYFSRSAESTSDGEEQARAYYWLAKQYSELGEQQIAFQFEEQASHADSLDFYAMRGRAHDLLGFPDTSAQPPAEPNWALVEEWLELRTGAPEDVAARDALFEGDEWLRAVELLDAGMDERADDEFRALLEAHSGEPWLLYRLLRELDERGRYWLTSPAAYDLLAPGAPVEVIQLIYPLAYWNLVQEEAARNNIDPLLVLALMRQESLYDPGAISSAEAMGLMQVIPPTADGIAAELGVEGFRYPDLLRPRVSVRFGSHYLGGLVEGFGGVLPAALAGYNGGPGNSGYWWELAGGDIDLFVEAIEFPETRAYVELVMENYALYLHAYGYTQTANLPLD